MVTHYRLHDSVLYSTRVSAQRKANQTHSTGVGLMGPAPAGGARFSNSEGKSGSWWCWRSRDGRFLPRPAFKRDDEDGHVTQARKQKQKEESNENKGGGPVSNREGTM